MTETNASHQQSKNKPHVAPADAASPLFTAQQFWRTEMGRVLDETSTAFERNSAEFERASAEANRFAQAQVKAMHEAGRAWIAGVRTMMG